MFAKNVDGIPRPDTKDGRFVLDDAGRDRPQKRS